MWNADKLGYRGNAGYNRAYEGDELVWEKQQPGPLNNELWYTSTDGTIIRPTRIWTLPTIVSNIYEGDKGVLTFEDNLVTIGTYSFSEVERLRTIILPQSTITIGDHAFSGCRRLISAIISDSVQTIGNRSFYMCTLLSTLTIGKGVTLIDYYAFNYCQKLTNITYNGTMEQWAAITKRDGWKQVMPATVVHCSDGDAPI